MATTTRTGGAAPGRQLETALRRVQQMEDEREIIGLYQKYPHYMDYAKEEVFMDLWTDDAVFEGRFLGQRGARTPFKHVGKGAIRGWWAKNKRGRPISPPTVHHFFTMPLVEVNGDKATLQGIFFGLRDGGEAGSAAVFTFGRIEDVMAREKGRWRIKHRRLSNEFLINEVLT